MRNLAETLSYAVLFLMALFGLGVLAGVVALGFRAIVGVSYR